MDFYHLKEAKYGQKTRILKEYQIKKTYISVDEKNKKATICYYLTKGQEVDDQQFKQLQKMIENLDTKFIDVGSEVMKLDKKIEKVDSRLSIIEAKVDKNTEEIIKNRVAINKNAEAIAKNAEAIAKNAEAIARNSEAIDKNHHLIIKIMQTHTMKKELEEIK